MCMSSFSLRPRSFAMRMQSNVPPRFMNLPPSNYRVIVRTCFAYGADQLIAECANELGIATKAAIPDEYEKYIENVRMQSNVPPRFMNLPPSASSYKGVSFPSQSTISFLQCSIM